MNLQAALARALDGYVTPAVAKKTVKAKAKPKPKAASPQRPRGKYDLKSIRHGEIHGECPKGHRKEGRNLVWKQSRGRLFASCRICGNDASRESQYRKRFEARGTLKVVPGGKILKLGHFKAGLPLDPYSMRTLIALYERGDGAWTSESLGRETKISSASTCTLISRLRHRLLVKTEIRWEPMSRGGRIVNRAYHSLTEAGFTVVSAWIAFWAALGPVAKRLNWVR